MYALDSSITGSNAPDRIERPRLDDRLTCPGAGRITVLIGPAGSGKSELLRRYRTDPDALYFRAGREHATFGRLVQGLARAVSPVSPGAAASFPQAWERALQSRFPGTVLAHWLAEHLRGRTYRLVVDDLYDAASDANGAAFISGLAELRPEAGLTLALRDPGKLPIGLWMATQRLDRPIDARELAFDSDEIAAIADRFGLAAGPLPSSAPVVAIVYELSRARAEGRPTASAPVASFDAIAQAIFSRCSERERTFLRSAALLPAIDETIVGRSTWEDADRLCAAFGPDAAFMWEREEGRRRFFDRFRDYLATEFAACDPQFRLRIASDTFELLVADGRYSEALGVATRQLLVPAMTELVELHGFAMLEAGNVDGIAEALAVMEHAGGALNARAMALRGYLDARSGRVDTSEAWFRLAIERAGDEASGATIAMYYAHELALRRRTDSSEALAPFAASTTLPRELRIDVRSSYAQALTAANELDEAARQTDEALALVDARTPASLRARVYARAAYVALECGQPALARERALIAAPLAASEALYDVAASSYSVLYNVAYEIDDDAVAGLEYLARLRDLALKSGTLRLDLYALIGIYHLQAEAGNETALAALDAEIGSIDKQDATSDVMDGLVPARALQAAWSGRFADAVRLLTPTLEHQAGAERRALCRAFMALYSAAAGDVDAASVSMNDAASALDQEHERTVGFARTQLILALAAATNGDRAGAGEWLERSRADVPGPAPRLTMLRSAVAALLHLPADTERRVRIAAALHGLRDMSYGGMANVIEALPDRLAGGGESVALGLCAPEFSTRFEAALDTGTIAALADWLTSYRIGMFSDVSLVERYERWAAAQPVSDERRAAAMQTLGTQIAVYRLPAPAIARMVDDVDAAIEELVVHLDRVAPLMAEHSRAVSAWCSRIARALGLSQRDSEFVTRGGLIHDIGKVWTPAEILNAPRRLDSREWEIMRAHAADGGRMVAEDPLLRPFVRVVRGHHERLDGTGYPDGLRGSAIPLAARIVSVADSFNAMIGRRPYRLPMEPTDALAELERNRGTQFDPEVTDALIRIVQGRLVEDERGPH